MSYTRGSLWSADRPTNFHTRTNTAPSIGPILGAVLADLENWRWIFWFLAVLSSLCLVAIILTLPETARRIVGNGGIAVKGLHRAPFCKPSILPSADCEDQLFRNRLSRGMPNPWVTLQLLSKRDIAAVVMSIGIFYTAYSCLQASLATVFMHEYGYGQLEAGLIYLPFGFGCALTAYLTGTFFGWTISRGFSLTRIVRKATRPGLSYHSRIKWSCNRQEI